MLKGEIAESAIIAIWVLVAFVFWALGAIMRNSSDGQQQQKTALQGRANNRFIPSSFRAISGYLRIVSSGASTVARSAASVAQSIVDRDDDANPDQVLWAGFDELEGYGDVVRHVLHVGYQSGFQVWDVEEADNVHNLVSRYEGPVSFLQMLPKPIASKRSEDKFGDSRPLLVVCANGTHSSDDNPQDGRVTPYNGTNHNYHDLHNGSFVPTVRFYSIRSHSYVHVLKFRSVVYSVRCSSRIVAISQVSQIHCFDATSLERAYTIVTNPIVIGSPGLGGTGYGPLALGPRWLAYSGSPVVVSNSGRVNPQHLTPSSTFSGNTSNGSFVVHYAKESSKQLATGIVTIGDMGYRKLSRYCSELLPDSHGSLQSGLPGWKGNGTANGHVADGDNVGMVVVRDIVSKLVIAHFRAHKSPISALCFDPSGTLLVTASVHGQNINVFRIMPGQLGGSAGDAGVSHAHLYRLQRGFTNAIIQDISFSDDSNWVVISSSRGTSHLFAINPLGVSANFHHDSSYTLKKGQLGVIPKLAVQDPTNLGLQLHSQQSLCTHGPPVSLSAVSRIKNGNKGWRGTVTGAAVAATGRLTSPAGVIASSFHTLQSNGDLYVDDTSLTTKYHLLVFSPSSSMIKYALRIPASSDLTTIVSGSSLAPESASESDGRLVVEAIQKWNICGKQNHRDQEDNVDIYGENGNLDSSKVLPGGMRKGNCVHPNGSGGLAQAKVNCDEKHHHLYISEAELQMHQARIPLWTKPEVSFWSMITEQLKLDEEDMNGEIEIERIPTRIIEARSKGLIPVVNHLQTMRFDHSSSLNYRVPALDGNVNGCLQHWRSGLSESSRLSCQSSSGSLDLMTNICGVPAELHNGIAETGRNNPRMPIETRGFVNSNAGPKANTRVEIVNNRDHLRMEDQINFLTNHNEGLQLENHFEDEDDEFD